MVYKRSVNVFLLSACLPASPPCSLASFLLLFDVLNCSLSVGGGSVDIKKVQDAL